MQRILRKFLQSDIMEKQPKSSNIDDSYKSDKKSFQSLSRHHDLETFTQQASSSRINYIRNNGGRIFADYEEYMDNLGYNHLLNTKTMNLQEHLLQNRILWYRISSNAEFQRLLFHQIQFISFYKENFVDFFQKYILNIKSDNKLINHQESSLHFINSIVDASFYLQINVKNRREYAFEIKFKQLLAISKIYDKLVAMKASVNIKKRFLYKACMNQLIPESNLNSKKSSKKSKNNKKSNFAKSSPAESSPMEQLNAIKNRNKRFHELYERFEQLSEMRRKNADSEEQVKAVFGEALLSRDRTEQMPRELNLNNTTESNENDEGSSDYENKDKEMLPKIDEKSFISASASLAKESQSSQECVKKIESDSKSKDEKSMELCRAEFSFAGSRNVYSGRFQEYLQNIHSFDEWYNEELDAMRKGIKDLGVLNLETSLTNETYHKLIAMRASENIKKQFLYEVCMREIIQEDSLNSTSENSESNKKSKDNKAKNYEKSSVESSPPKSSSAEQLIENERLHELYEKFEQLSEVRKRYDDLVDTHAKAIVDIFFFENTLKRRHEKSETYNQLYSIESLPAESFSMEPASAIENENNINFKYNVDPIFKLEECAEVSKIYDKFVDMRASVKIKKQFLYEIYMNQIIREDNLNSTAENSEGNEKSKGNKSENCKESYSIESSPSEASSAIQLNAMKKRNKRLHELYELFEQLSKIRIIFDNITEREVKARIERILQFEARTEEIPQKDNLYSTTENSKNDEKAKNYQNGEKENCHMDQKIDEKPSFRSTDAAVAKESQSSQECIKKLKRKLYWKKDDKFMELSRTKFCFTRSSNAYSGRFLEYVQKISSYNKWYHEQLDAIKKSIKRYGVDLENTIISKKYDKFIAMRASVKIKKQFLYDVYMKQIIQEDNSNSMSENSESDENSKDNKSKNCKESYFMEMSPPKSSPTEQLKAIENRNKRLDKIYKKFEQLSEIRKKYDDLVETQASAVVKIFLSETHIEEIPQTNNLCSLCNYIRTMAKNHKSDEKSKDIELATYNELNFAKSLFADFLIMESMNATENMDNMRIEYTIKLIIEFEWASIVKIYEKFVDMRAEEKIKKQFLYEIYMNQIIQEDNLNSTSENNEGNEKSKDNKSENCKESYSMESSPSESSSAIRLNAIKKRNKRLHDLYHLFEILSEARNFSNDVIECEVKARIEGILETQTKEIPQKDNLNSTTKNSKNEKSKNYQNGEKENCNVDQKIDKKEDAILTSQKVAKKNNSNSKDENEDDKEPLDYQSTKNKICPFVPRCLPKVKKMLYMCTILLFLYLTFIFQYRVSFHKNHKDNNTSIDGEWTKDFLDLNEIVQFLTEYHQENSSLLKVVALIDATSFDNSYTVDIIRNSLRRRKINKNFSSSLFPDFIILKNLGVKHCIKFTECIINFIKRFEKAHSDKRFTIITNFKVEHKAHNFTPNVDLHRTINTVKDAFIEANINIKVIPYEFLNKETLEEYVLNTAEDIRLPQNKNDLIKRRLIEHTRWRISNTVSELAICNYVNVNNN